MGDDGLHIHLQNLQSIYAKRRDFLVGACEEHLTGLCKWSQSEFGMFLWLEVLGMEDVGGQFVEDLIVKYGIAMVPGGAFIASGECKCNAFRVSYTMLTEEKAQEGMKRLKRGLQEMATQC